MGCALISQELVRLHESRGLVRTAPVAAPPSRQGHFLLVPRRSRRISAEAMAFRDWMLARFRGAPAPP